MGGGRQREFCEQEALKKAMHIFWEKGYVGTSLTDLTEGMGINKPSMYATFGNKEALFIKAVKAYVEQVARPKMAALDDMSIPLKERLKAYLKGVVNNQYDCNNPSGCLLTFCSSEAGADSLPPEAQAMIESVNNNNASFLTSYLTECQERGELEPSINPKTLALYCLSMMNGCAVLAKGGQPQKAVMPMIDLAFNHLDL